MLDEAPMLDEAQKFKKRNAFSQYQAVLKRDRFWSDASKVSQHSKNFQKNLYSLSWGRVKVSS